MYPTKPLGEICDIKTGKKDANYATDDGLYPFFTCGREILKSPGYSFDTDAILIAGNGDVGACKKYNGKFEAYQRTYVLDNFQNIDKNFLFYFLDGNLKKELLNETLGSAIPYIKLGSLQKRIIPLPPLSTQQKIVEKLDKIFAKIDKNISLTKQNIANIEEENNVLLKKFSNFPKAKISEIAEKIFAGGDLPKNGNFSKELTEEYQIPIFANAIKDDGLYGFTNEIKVDEPALTISARGTIGFVKLRTKPFYPIVRLIVLIPKKEIADLKFLEYMIRTLNLKQFGSSIPQLSVPQLKNFQIPLPPLPKQQEIVTYLDDIFAKNSELKNFYEKNLKNLEELKQSILKQAFEDENFIK